MRVRSLNVIFYNYSEFHRQSKAFITGRLRLKGVTQVATLPRRFIHLLLSSLARLVNSSPVNDFIGPSKSVGAILTHEIS